MTTFDEAILKFRDCPDAERDPYAAILREAVHNPNLRAALLAMMQEVNPEFGFFCAFSLGVMVGIEMEKREEL